LLAALILWTTMVRGTPRTPQRSCTPKVATPKLRKEKRSKSSTGGRAGRPNASPAKRQHLLQDALRSPLQEAQARLHVSAVPDSLPCREDMFAEIYAFVASKLGPDGCGGCIYISGVPGTGKTATVMDVVRTLKREAVDEFNFVEINGMRLTEPAQAYAHLWRALEPRAARVTPAHARDLLERRFEAAAAGSGKRTSNATVLLVDELDKLWNRKQSVLYNLFDWPTLPGSRLIVLAIANTMDLPEKMLINRVSSRLGLTRCQFPPYTHEQLICIVAARLDGLEVFDPDAVQLVARKVASLSGDARRALDICRRATEIAQREGGGEGLVGMAHVSAAHEEMYCSPRITAIRCCSEYQKLFLRSIVACFRKTGFEETSFNRVLDCLNEQLTMSHRKSISSTLARELLSQLSACRLVLADGGRRGPDARIWLNVSPDDIIFALDSAEKQQ